MEKIMFGAGCFWGVETAFRKISGVDDVAVGYSGGKTENPTYQDICSHGTGHAEVVLVDFDPNVVSFERLCEAFFSLHAPTQLNRQGPDVGRQYRSVIFTHDQEQADAAAASTAKMEDSKRSARPVVTEISPMATFWRAENYHQRYFERRGLRHHVS